MIGSKKGITFKDKNHKHFLFENTPPPTKPHQQDLFGDLSWQLKNVTVDGCIWQTMADQPVQLFLQICLDFQQDHNIHLLLSPRLLN